MTAPANWIPNCPDRCARAPRAAGASGRLLAIPPSLRGAFVAVVWRDIRGRALDDAQRLSHFPATPLLCLAWYPDGEVGLVSDTPGAARWRAFDAALMLSGSQSMPTTSWAPLGVRGGMACFTPDVARALFGIEPRCLQDRFVTAPAVLDPVFAPLCRALCDASDEFSALAALEQHLAPRWDALRGPESPALDLAHVGRHWLQNVGLHAQRWRRTLGLRQVERRVKEFSGRSFQQWKSLVQTEGVFGDARARHDRGDKVCFVALAAEHGFSDQAHMIRATRRITGFTPQDFAKRFVEDESFWFYRLWT